MPDLLRSASPSNSSGNETLPYNAASDLIERNLRSDRGRKVAVVDDRGSYTYSDLAERMHRCGNALRSIGITSGHKIILWLPDSIDFTTAFLGSIEAGIIPIPLSTLTNVTDMIFFLRNSGANGAVVAEPLLSKFLQAAGSSDWRGLVVVAGSANGRHLSLSQLMSQSSNAIDTVATKADDPCFWLYSSGSTGKPKGVVHRHRSMVLTAELFARGILGIKEDDVVYSAARLSFAFGLGNALVFPIAFGATAILSEGRFSPSKAISLLREQRPTIFCAVPSLFNSLLAVPDMVRSGDHAMRLCVSAGEALPESVGLAWRRQTGVDVLDGIGSTEMLHIYLSNRPGAVKYGTTGRPVPGYRVRLVGETGKEVALGEVGELQVSGPTAAACYWNEEAATRNTFQGEWVRTGDNFRQTPEGDFIFCGRADDMLKIDGMWVSPLEVESILLEHDSVLEAAIVNRPDTAGLSQVKAYVVVKENVNAGPELERVLIEYTKTRLARYKCPQSVEFLQSLPKTATGKLKRKVLREL